MIRAILNQLQPIDGDFYFNLWFLFVALILFGLSTYFALKMEKSDE